jgi:hypothetical protein
MFAYRRGLGFDFLSQGADGAQLKYWELLRDHLERNPDEPPGWRERVDEIKRDREAWKKEAASPGPR